ncbi:MAG: lysylphosphatidylglycerol synthase transmembrane domain-containing protein [Candidatus Parcubacteria bacterium]|nr:lysylphosphatidylglycerol synthase transmembrane domain-containing protein [Candidatus Parcubacteria bacterium]
MKGIIGFLISLVLGSLVFGYALKKVDVLSLKTVWQALNFKTLGLVLVTYLVAFLLAILRWRIFNNKQGVKISFKQMVLARLAGNAFNYLTPLALAGGESVKVLVAANGNKENYKKITATVLVEELIHFAVLGFFVFFGTLYSLIRYIHSPQIDIFVILFVILIFTISILMVLWFGVSRIKMREEVRNKFFARVQKWKFLKKLEQSVRSLREEMSLVFNNGNRVVINGTLLAVGDILISALMWWFLLAGMGYSLSFPQYVVVWSLLYLAFLVPVPAALGVLELGQIAAFGILEFNNPQAIALAFSLTNRGVTVFFTIIGLMIACYFWLKITIEKCLGETIKTTQNIFKFFVTLGKQGLFINGNGPHEENNMILNNIYLFRI